MDQQSMNDLEKMAREGKIREKEISQEEMQQYHRIFMAMKYQELEPTLKNLVLSVYGDKVRELEIAAKDVKKARKQMINLVNTMKDKKESEIREMFNEEELKAFDALLTEWRTGGSVLGLQGAAAGDSEERGTNLEDAGC